MKYFCLSPSRESYSGRGGRILRLNIICPPYGGVIPNTFKNFFFIFSLSPARRSYSKTRCFIIMIFRGLSPAQGVIPVRRLEMNMDMHLSPHGELFRQAVTTTVVAFNLSPVWGVIPRFVPIVNIFEVCPRNP